MNRIVIMGLIFTVCLSCTNKSTDNKAVNELNSTQTKIQSDSLNTTNLPIIQFEKDVHDFGRIYQSEKVSYSFKFKNIGLANLIIKDARASCGCTVPTYSHEPIPSGGEGEIEVSFDSNNRTGKQIKTITLWTNCKPDEYKLEIITEIVVPN